MILHPGHNLHITIFNLYGHFNHQHSQGKIAEDSRYFPFFQKIGLDISCKLSPNCQALFEKTETNFMKCQALVSGKKNTNILRWHLALSIIDEGSFRYSAYSLYV